MAKGHWYLISLTDVVQIGGIDERQISSSDFLRNVLFVYFRPWIRRRQRERDCKRYFIEF